VPLIAVNYLIQRRWIFQSEGRLWKFVTAHLAIMAFVSILSPVCRFLNGRVATTDWANGGGFILAALVGSILSFFIQREWVFRETRLA
jgi:putative flippase GtrA